MIWLIRMAQWVRHPPSPRKVKVVFATIAICLVILGAEAIWGWPEWLSVNTRMRVPH